MWGGYHCVRGTRLPIPRETQRSRLGLVLPCRLASEGGEGKQETVALQDHVPSIFARCTVEVTGYGGVVD